MGLLLEKRGQNRPQDDLVSTPVSFHAIHEANVDSIYPKGQFENPGPAPQPPTSRPRLNLMPSTRDIPGNMSQSNLSSSNVSKTALQRSETSMPVTNTSGGPGTRVLKEGFAKCKDGLFWKKRYLVLKPFHLEFQNKEKEGKVSIIIYLKDVTSVARSEDFPMSFEISRMADPTQRDPALSAKDHPQKTMICQLKADEEIYDWIEVIYNRCPGIGGVSNPTNFTHTVHVGFDPKNGKFVGLPLEWEKLLSSSAITKEDFQRNPEGVVEALEFYHKMKNGDDEPESYLPTPPAAVKRDVQLGHGGGGTNIAPPRPPPPSGPPIMSPHAQQYYSRSQKSPSNDPQSIPAQPYDSPSRARTPSSHRNASKQEHDDKTVLSDELRQQMDKQARDIQMQKRQDREEERKKRERGLSRTEANRQDDDPYYEELPRTRTPTARQEIGGGYTAPDDNRYNPTRNAPEAPAAARSRQQVQQQGSSRSTSAHRQQAAPRADGSPQALPRAPYAQKESTSRSQSPSNAQQSLRAPRKPDQNQVSLRTPGRSDQTQVPLRAPDKPDYEVKLQDHNAPGMLRRPGPSQSVTNIPSAMKGRKKANEENVRANGSQPSNLPRQQASTRIPGAAQPAVAPLRVKQPVGSPAEAAEAHKQTEIALTARPAEARQKEVRMSSMTEGQVMEKLKQVVSKDDPQLSYSKQKKIGQGASGSVYVAKIQENAISPVAQRIYRTQGSKSQVAIKQMDLRNQPRKELIVNEIIVMKESHHPNIVNFLDSFLQEGNNELWVVMEFMEGGALTDVIDGNNGHITEAQISTICNEVSALWRQV